jgi:hypothetical protein
MIRAAKSALQATTSGRAGPIRFHQPRKRNKDQSEPCRQQARRHFDQQHTPAIIDMAKSKQKTADQSQPHALRQFDRWRSS